MSLYHDAVSVLTTPSPGGSFKSRIYSARLKSPAQVYALIIESAKWDILLKEVIEETEVLKEPKVTPLLALFLVHDHLLSNNGIATATNHPLRLSIEKHKTRLKGEFIKARVRRACASIDELRVAVLREKATATGAGTGSVTTVYPRWVRVNTIRTTLEKQLKGTFASYEWVSSLSELSHGDTQKRLFIDPYIPDLLAVPPGVEFTTCPAYKNGELILQDKASCIPAFLLAGKWECEGDLVDGCAAPGNKTTHLAALATTKSNGKIGNILSMDASPTRSKTLQKMVAAAGTGDIVTVIPGQDFLSIDPDTDARFKNATGLLLDPSCSGSGIIGRDDVPQLILPSIPNQKQKQKQGQGKKRKRDTDTSQSSPAATTNTDEDDIPNTTVSKERLTKLSNIQARIVEHAFSFPSAVRVTYSTCSIHVIENEAVVERVLRSDVARRRGWRVLRRGEQAVGLRGWKHRGVKCDLTSNGSKGKDEGMKVGLSGEELEGCLRCWPGDEEGVGGFFVVGFIRDGDGQDGQDGDGDDDDAVSDEWEGFSD